MHLEHANIYIRRSPGYKGQSEEAPATFRPKVHKEENDPGCHSLCIGSQADKEGKVEKAESYPKSLMLVKG